MAKLEFDDEGSRLVEAINTVPDTIGRRQAIMRALNLKTGEQRAGYAGAYSGPN